MCSCANLKFSSKPYNQIASLTASVIVMYYVVDSSTVDYSVDYQLINPQEKVNTYSVVDCRLSKLLTYMFP